MAHTVLPTSLTADCTSFVQTVWAYYREHDRSHLPWRQPEADGSFDPYKIMVSEIMLQQTQVGRVIAKYEQFLQLFPTVQTLAAAPLAEVLKAWSGLGYNRRAKFLWQAAQMVATEYDGVFPQTVDQLVSLPGVGKNTAGAIAAYAFDRPVLFIETNIRTVFIHHFFGDRDNISDAELAVYIRESMDLVVADGTVGHSPRTWYWALMDYGTFVKQTVGNLSRNSKVYAKQSAFEGSKRQVRGNVLRALADGALTLPELAATIVDDRLPDVVQALCAEAIISCKDDRYYLGSS